MSSAEKKRALIEHTRAGLSLPNAAKAAGVARSTAYFFKKNDPDFAVAIVEATSMAQAAARLGQRRFAEREG